MPSHASTLPAPGTHPAASPVHRIHSRPSRAESRVRSLLSQAGVEVGGDNPWDIQVLDPRVYTAVLARGSLGLGDAYVAGWWDCPRLDELFFRILRAGLSTPTRSLPDVLIALKARLFNRQSTARAFQVAERHYDLGNELYRRMLDPRLIYSCGYWKDAATLDQAQDAKLDLVCRKLGLQPGMRVLDIGCGWGGMAQYAAEHYGVEVVGVTVSERQAEEARAMCEGHRVTIELRDYRALSGRFDRILSIGMFEHVGPKNYATYMDVARRLLVPDGLFLLHTIGSAGAGADSGFDAWIERHIFPNAVLPTGAQLAAASQGRFIIEDWHAFGQDYDRTLMAWHRNLQPHHEWIGQVFGERFVRMWNYYLLTCAASFRARCNQLWQVLLSPQGLVGGHASIR